jgi:hypothetical protein
MSNPNVLPAAPVDWITEVVNQLPANYRPPENLDFLRRFLTPTAETLQQINEQLDTFVQKINPFTCPLDFLDYWLTETMGWTLFPALPGGYPEARKRRLLNDLFSAEPSDPNPLAPALGLIYPRRYTVAGIKALLLEFGIHAVVTDQPQYVGSYMGLRAGPYRAEASQFPLQARIVVQWYEPLASVQNVYVGNYLGHIGAGNLWLYDVRPSVDEAFVLKLAEWSRIAGARFQVEFARGGYKSPNDSVVLG